jgi:AAA domain
MATLNSKVKNDPLKLLLIGDSGTGKTGALASLANSGKELFILDLDNGTDILQFVVKDEFKKNVHIETLTDTGKLVGGGTSQKIQKLNPQAFPKALGLLSKWKDSETGEDFGPVSSWSTNRVLVVDSLSFLGMASLDYVLAKNGRGGDQPHQGDWGESMRMLEQTLQILYSTEIKCNVVVISHITYQTVEGSGITKGLPMGLGSQLPPKIGRYFNMSLVTKSRGAGENQKRVILTKPENNVDCKCPILGAPKELPIESGLADMFKLWDGRNGPTTTSKFTAPLPSIRT